MPLTWTVDAQSSDDDLRVISKGVISHGRAQAWDGQAEPICCLVREGSRVAAGEVVLHPARPAGRARTPKRDRFDAVRGRADVPWRTDELMKLLRADD